MSTAALVVLIAGVVMGMLLWRAQGVESTQVPVATTGAVTTLPSISTTATTEDYGFTETTLYPATTPTTAELTPTSAPFSPAVTDDWPEMDGWTVIIESLDVNDPSSERTARDHAANMMYNDGIEAGVLYSSGYSSLNPGYWVVFSGFFSTKSEADSYMTYLRDIGYPEAYSRQIAR